MKPHRLVGFLVLAACSSKPAPAPSPEPAGKLEHRMANCPTAVTSASTKVVDTPDGVDVVITATEPAAQERIRTLSNAQTEMGEPPVSDHQHTGLHGGPGWLGHCPIIHGDTVVTVTTNDTGATLHIRALDSNRVKSLQDETAARAAL
jgi:TusA-related sulfurtransferase